MPRHDRFAETDVSVDRYERDYVSRNGRGRGEREREREREVIFKERDDVRYGDGPEILREDYGRTTAGPLVLRKKETEDFEYAPRPRRRPPTPEPESKVSREEIIIRRKSPSPERPPPRREREFERDEIVIRRDEHSRDARSPLPREVDTSREEVIVRRDDRERRGPRYDNYERDEVIIRRDGDQYDRRPPPPRDFERDEIIIRHDEDRYDRRPPPPRDFERDEIIIRRDEREEDRRPPPPRDFDRQEIIIRRDEREEDRRPPPPRDFDRQEIIIRRDEREEDRRPPPRDFERDEIIIRRDEREDDRISRVPTRSRDDYSLGRPISHERERSRVGRGSSEHDDEIIIRRDEREGRGRDRDRQQEIIIRHNSRSPSPVSSVRAPPPVEPAPIFAPPIHREIIYHERHIDHGYETALARIPSRAPSPPTPPPPPPPRERSEERIEIRRTGERNGRAYDEDIIIDRNQGARGGRRAPEPELPPARVPYREREEIDIREERGPRGYRREEIDIQEEADYYNQRAVDKSYIGEGFHGSTRDWEIVDVPPGTRRVKMDGAAGGSQEITWQRYNGVRRSKFMPDGTASDEGYASEIARSGPSPGASAVASAASGVIGPRYGPRRKEGDGLWTEITKDLVVKDAITQAGYEFEETDDFYYIMSYLKYVSSRFRLALCV